MQYIAKNLPRNALNYQIWSPKKGDINKNIFAPPIGSDNHFVGIFQTV